MRRIVSRSTRFVAQEVKLSADAAHVLMSDAERSEIRGRNQADCMRGTILVLASCAQHPPDFSGEVTQVCVLSERDIAAILREI